MRFLKRIAITIGIITSLSMINCTREESREAIGSTSMMIEIIRTNMVTTVTTTGHIHFTQQTELTFGEGGTVLSAFGDWGTRVKTGDLIGQLDDGALELAVGKAETNWLNSKDSLQTLLNGPSKATLQKAQASFFAATRQATNSNSKEKDAQLDYQNVFQRWLGIEIPLEELSFPPQQVLSNLGIDLESLFVFPDRPFKLPQWWNSALFGGDLSKPDAILLRGNDPETPWDETIVQAWKLFFPGQIVSTCIGQTQQVKAQLALCIDDEMTTKWETYHSAVVSKLKDQAELLAAEETLSEIQKPLDLKRVKEHEQQMAGTHYALLEAKRNLEQAKIFAPFDGVLTEMNITVGNQVAPRAVAAKMVNPSSVEIIVQVDEIDISKINLENPASVSIDAFPNLRIKTRVAAISLVGRNQSGVVTYQVRLEILDGLKATLREGMTIIAEIQVQNIENILAIPLLAIQTQDGIRGVLIVTEPYPQSEATFRPLEFGESNDRVVSVISGLEEGEKILIPSAPNQFSELSGRQGRFPGSGIFGGGNHSRP